MLGKDEIQERFRMQYHRDEYRRIIGSKDIILHCHHYNARLQRSIESVRKINGEQIIRQAAEFVFAEHIESVFKPSDSVDVKWQLAQELYCHLGFGILDFSSRNDKVIKAPHSHLVQGWQACFAEKKEEREFVCTFTEGYIQGMYKAITGKLTNAREHCCKISGSTDCLFTVNDDRSEPWPVFERNSVEHNRKGEQKTFVDSNIDYGKILNSLIEMPIMGGPEGMIPAFGVYLANMPADFYNFICIKFVEAMGEKDLETIAIDLLISDGEFCGLNTFNGIINSHEWEGLISPMVQNRDDCFHGLVAVSNALGWGNWYIEKLESGDQATLVSSNGYEALGYLQNKGKSKNPRCFMLQGVATGMTAVVYSFGTMNDRYGTFSCEEEQCIAMEHDTCRFAIEKADE